MLMKFGIFGIGFLLGTLVGFIMAGLAACNRSNLTRSDYGKE